MVRIMGNSPERVRIKDLDDIIYYKQIKEYTDQEFEDSNDLKRAVKQGKVAKIDSIKTSRGSAEIQGHSTGKNLSSISLKDLKTALREILPEFKNNEVSALKNAVREIGPLIVDMVRQEISKLTETKHEVTTGVFKGPEYIPDISTDGMVSSIEAKQREVTADNVDDNLTALRKLQNEPKSE